MVNLQIEQALKKFKDSDKMSYAALVECVSNLTANEMFDENYLSTLIYL